MRNFWRNIPFTCSRMRALSDGGMSAMVMCVHSAGTMGDEKYPTLCQSSGVYHWVTFRLSPSTLLSGLDAEANTWPVVRLYQSIGQYLRPIDSRPGWWLNYKSGTDLSALLTQIRVALPATCAIRK